MLLVSFGALAFAPLRNFALALDGLLLILVAIDLIRTPSPDEVEIERRLPERVGLSRDARRELELVCPAARNLRVEVDEEFPAAFHVRARTVDGERASPASDDPSGGEDSGRFSEAGRARLVRIYRSDLRGPFRFGDLRVRLRGPGGWIERSKRFDGPQEIAVEPALAGLQQSLRLAASERWRDLGVRLVRRRGGERDFESLRDYVHGDDPRRVDWKAFARRGKPMVRQYQVERGQELLLLIDLGRRMRVTTAQGRRRGWTKLDWALDAALELAAVVLSKGDRVGVAAFERGLLRYVAPAKGQRQHVRLSRALFDLQPGEQEADLARALRELALRHRRRATVLVISDVADPYSVEVQREALAQASRRHRVIFAALDDPGLRAAVEGRSADAAVRAAALELMEDRSRALRQLATSGARVLDALPAEAAAPLLAAWLDERRS